ncbi:hypothetical protein [Clostridium sp.]|uniref:hypothetical protein n=1 Tax=Clostridium sp. TaxID=1506 RepID=UPI0026DBDC31|nr:hypothetical protein [Clostridium sp.]MDO5038829.1 hypothetical protein [Clostridium sp.]
MRYIKGKWVYLFIIFLLLLIIPLILHIFHGQGNEKIEFGNEFINTLKENNIIKEEKKNIRFNIEKRNLEKSDEEIYLLKSKFYMIEINKDNKIISFVDKRKTDNKINITLDESVKIAKKYINKIDGINYKLKEIDKNDTNKDSNFYSVIFLKYEEGYPYFSQEVILNINKNTGKLQGYINKTKNSDHESIKINISKDNAEKIALNFFNKVQKEGHVKTNSYLAFCNSAQNERLELAYVVEVSNEKTDKIFFISAKSGKIINIISNVIDKIEVK